MTEEIQKRIEAIKAGKVPDGYKKAVVGIVPSEWQEKRLSDLLKFQNGVHAEKENFNSGIKMLSHFDTAVFCPVAFQVCPAGLPGLWGGAALFERCDPARASA